MTGRDDTACRAPDCDPMADRPSLSDRLLLGAALLTATFCLAQLLLMPYGRDQGIYAVVADAVLRGGMPYRDAWDFKPPGVFLVYAAARAVFGPAPWGIRAVDALGFASLVPVFAVLSRRFFADARPGILGACAAIIVHAQQEFWHTAQPESFGAILTAVGLLLATTPASSRIPWRAWLAWGASGFLFGAAGLMKPQLAGAALPAAIYVVLGLRDRGVARSGQAAAVLVLSAGGLMAVGACLGWFWARGALGDLTDTLFVFAPGYAATTFRPDRLLGYVFEAASQWAVGASWFVSLGLVLAAILRGPGAQPQRVSARRGVLLILSVAAIHLLGIAVQAKFFAYHYDATLPLGAFLGGLGVWKGWRLASRCGVAGRVAMAALVAVAIGERAPVRDLAEPFLARSVARTAAFLRADAEQREALDARLYSVADVDQGANVRVARWIAANTAPSEPVFIWGFEPVVYDMAGRRPASRFIYNVPQRASWERASMRDRLMADLAALPPRVIVVERGDVFPVVTGNHEDSAAALQGFPALAAVVRDGYELQAQIQDFDLYVQTVRPR